MSGIMNPIQIRYQLILEIKWRLSIEYFVKVTKFSKPKS